MVQFDQLQSVHIAGYCRKFSFKNHRSYIPGEATFKAGLRRVAPGGVVHISLVEALA